MARFSSGLHWGGVFPQVVTFALVFASVYEIPYITLTEQGPTCVTWKKLARATRLHPSFLHYLHLRELAHLIGHLAKVPSGMVLWRHSWNKQSGVLHHNIVYYILLFLRRVYVVQTGSYRNYQRWEKPQLLERIPARLPGDTGKGIRGAFVSLIGHSSLKGLQTEPPKK